MTGCRGCAEPALTRAVDLGAVPAADLFPPAGPADVPDPLHPLAMDVCAHCGLVQLADDDTAVQEPRGVEPQALTDQAAAAVADVAAAGWLTGGLVREFGSPHGGSWLPLLHDRGYRTAQADEPADVVVDSFGIMHAADQRAAFAARAAALRPGGVLLLQYHAVGTIVSRGQWNALRHGHFAYYSLTTLCALLGAAGLAPAHAWHYDLYGGTVLLAVTHAPVSADDSIAATLAAERSLGVTSPQRVAALQRAADGCAAALRGWLREQADAGLSVYAYGAASRAVALFSLAGIDARLVTAVADASPAKQGRRMPGTDVPIIAPADLVAARPDRVLLTLSDLLPELRAQFPELDGTWKLDADFMVGVGE